MRWGKKPETELEMGERIAEDPERGGNSKRPGLDLSGDHAPGLNPGTGVIGLDLCPDARKGQIHTPDPSLGRRITVIDGTTLGLYLGAQ